MYLTVFKRGLKILTWFRSWPFFSYSALLQACRLISDIVATYSNAVSALKEADTAFKRTWF